MEYLFLIALGWFVSEFEPFKLIANYLYMKSGNKTYLEYIFGVFDCWQCSTFWASLIWTWDIKAAIIASFIVYVLNTIQELWMLKRGR
jgi:hypothetical protein